MKPYREYGKPVNPAEGFLCAGFAERYVLII